MPSEDLQRMQEVQARVANPNEKREMSPIWNYWRRKSDTLESEHGREESLIDERLERLRKVA